MRAPSSPVVHLELHSANLARACAFYTELLGWRAEAIRVGERSYMALAMGSDLEGGIVECSAPRAVWLPYVEVDDVAETTRRAQAMGASVLLDPTEGPAGWRSVVVAPAGGEIALWQRKRGGARFAKRDPMAEPRASATRPDEEVLAAARDGDEDAFTRLVEPYRGELHAHCYRMLGSVHDAEDALQEALLRSWRGLARFEGRSSLRSWLYTIATNVSLDAIGRRPKRVLPVDYGPASDPHGGPGEPVVESVWVEPYPDETLGLEDGPAGPDARYEQREGVELAFIAALQHLPANQRAALILREVLGFSAREAAEMLDTSVASINSALQRARKTVEERLPEQSQQETLRSLGDDGVREVVENYIEAWLRGDVEAVVAMLTEDAAFTMPPLRTWFRGREEIAVFLAGWPLSGAWRWRTVRVRANGQEAIAFYTWDPDAQAYLRFALNVLTIAGSKIAEVDAFLTRSTEDPDRRVLARLPEQPFDPMRLSAAFERFGLPERLD